MLNPKYEGYINAASASAADGLMVLVHVQRHCEDHPWIERENKKESIRGRRAVGGGAAVTVLSMTKHPHRGLPAPPSSDRPPPGRRLRHSCAWAVPTMEAAEALRRSSPTRVITDWVADIHFCTTRRALAAAAAGAAKIRINPGNIGAQYNVAAVAACCKERGIPIRIGVNSRQHRARYPWPNTAGPPPRAWRRDAKRHVDMLLRCDFEDICLS
jgi:(E)-4-hydroxy-3-methylbut-2-enyl-diphosphate synthase